MNIDNIITIDMISLDFTASSKEDAIQKICTQLFFLKRTDASALLYNDIMKREKIVSTFAGASMAIPHVISFYIKEASLFFMRLKNEIIWDADDEKVKYVLLLAAPNSGDLNLLRQEQSYIFSSIAQAISNTETLRTWHDATDETEILNSLSKAFKAYLDE